MGMDDLDSTIDILEAEDAKSGGAGAAAQPAAAGTGKVLVGTIDKYFEKIGVAAIRLQGRLSVGDLIEIGSEEEAIRQRVSSMQIDRQDISDAGEGDDVGIKVNHPVPEGSSVYKLGGQP